MRLEVPVVITMTEDQITMYAQARGLDAANTKEITAQVTTDVVYETGGQYWTAAARQQRTRWHR